MGKDLKFTINAFLSLILNALLSTFLLAGDTLMPEILFKQPEFTQTLCACGPFTKNKNGRQKIKKNEVQYIFIKTNYFATRILNDTSFSTTKIYANIINANTWIK